MLRKKIRIGSGIASFLFSTMILTGMAYADGQIPERPANVPESSQTVSTTTPRSESRDDSASVASPAGEANTLSEKADAPGKLPDHPVNTETTYGNSPINPQNFGVVLSGLENLLWVTPTYNLQQGDLRFATEQEVQAAGWRQPTLVNDVPKNVGRYLVVVSQQGYDNILNWANGSWEGHLYQNTDGKIVGDNWIPSDKRNIELPPYNLASIAGLRWYAFYNVEPLEITAKLTGHMVVVNQETSQVQLDPRQFELALSPEVTGFNFALQAGDIALGQLLAGSSNAYQVVLTQQGHDRLVQALNEALDSGAGTDHAANYTLQAVDTTATLVQHFESSPGPIETDREIALPINYVDASSRQMISHDLVSGRLNQTKLLTFQLPVGYHLVGSLPDKDYTFRSYEPAPLVILIAKDELTPQPDNQPNQPAVTPGQQPGNTPQTDPQLRAPSSQVVSSVQPTSHAQVLPQTGNADGALALSAGAFLAILGSAAAKKRRFN